MPDYIADGSPTYAKGGRLNVVEFPKLRSPEDVLLEAVRMARGNDLLDVLIIGYDGDGHQVMIASGAVTRKDALWMLETAKGAVLRPEDDECADG